MKSVYFIAHGHPTGKAITRKSCGDTSYLWEWASVHSSLSYLGTRQIQQLSVYTEDNGLIKEDARYGVISSPSVNAICTSKLLFPSSKGILIKYDDILSDDESDQQNTLLMHSISCLAEEVVFVVASRIRIMHLLQSINSFVEVEDGDLWRIDVDYSPLQCCQDDSQVRMQDLLVGEKLNDEDTSPTMESTVAQCSKDTGDCFSGSTDTYNPSCLDENHGEDATNVSSTTARIPDRERLRQLRINKYDSPVHSNTTDYDSPVHGAAEEKGEIEDPHSTSTTSATVEDRPNIASALDTLILQQLDSVYSEWCRHTPALCFRNEISDVHDNRSNEAILLEEVIRRYQQTSDAGDTSTADQAHQTDAAAFNSNVAEEDDGIPTCRICRTSELEEPDQRLFRPCLCSGSLSHVHLDCLNEWRKTSTQAFYRCNVCQYEYNLQRSYWASLFLKTGSVGPYLIAVILIIIVSFALGCTVTLIDELVLGNWLLTYLELTITPFHSTCQKAFDTVQIVEKLNKEKDALSELSFEDVTLFAYVIVDFFFCCVPSVLRLLNVMIVGTFFLGCFGFAYNVLSNVYNVFFLPDVHGIRNVYIQAFMAVMFCLQFAQLGGTGYVIGFFICCREMCVYMLNQSRKLSLTIGETILEPPIHNARDAYR